MGSWGLVVNVLALGYGLFAIYLMLKSYGVEGAPWYDNYIVAVETGIIVVAGLVYMLASRAHVKSSAPAGDAIRR